MSEEFPRAFGKYVLLRPLAKGGMGEIYIAAGGQIGGFEKLCVIKKVIAEKADSAKANRFLDEAKVVLRLSHSCLVTTFDAGDVDGEFYIAMELLEGKDLREVWNRCVRTKQRIPLDVALHIVREVARALSYVHSYSNLKLVHRDVAPPNILLAYVGDVKLTDFGLARSVLKQEHTAPGVVFGRAAYLAPEQGRGEVADARTDVYTLGIVLWELLTGQQFLQISGMDPATSLAVVRHPKLVKPSTRAPWITKELDAVVMTALAADRKDRYASADEMRRALNEVIANIAPRAGADRVAEFLETIYTDAIAEERAERERYLMQEIPRFRASEGKARPRSSLPPPPPPAGVQPPSAPDAAARPKVRVASSSAASARRPSARPNPTMKATATAGTGGENAGPRKLPGLPPSPKPGAPGLATGAASARVAPRPAVPPPGVLQPAERKKPSIPTFDGQTETGREFAKQFIGRVLGNRYEIGDPIGEGGMGQVFSARHTEIGKRVAIKVLHPACSARADLVERFRLEARAASKIGHPGIVDVTDFGTTEEKLVYYVMEQLQGVDLAEVLAQERRIDVERAVQITIQCCKALQAAHEAAIIHRDLKPENIFLQPRGAQGDAVKIIDFGLARSLQEAAIGHDGRPLTNPGTPIGTPEYMAPEQADGMPADARSDLYAVGAILYEMITGQPAFAGQSFGDLVTRRGKPRSVRELVPEVSVELDAVIMATLEPDPGVRTQTMAELEYQLTKVLRGRSKAVAAVLGIEHEGMPPGPTHSESNGGPQGRRVAAFRAVDHLLATVGATVDGEDLTVPAATVFPDVLAEKPSFAQPASPPPSVPRPSNAGAGQPPLRLAAASRPPSPVPPVAVTNGQHAASMQPRFAAPPPIGAAFLARHGVKAAGQQPERGKKKTVVIAVAAVAVAALAAFLLGT